MTLVIPTGFRAWPADAIALSVPEIQRVYEAGFAGCGIDEEAAAEFDALQRWPDGEQAVTEFGLAGSGAGQLVAPWVHVEQMYPGSWPGAAQERGDCVSHDAKNAILLTHVCDVVSGQPDQGSGKPERPVEISPEGLQQGVFASEAVYWFRRHGGDGWSCDAAANVVTGESGAWIRQNYPDLGVDLTRYSGRNAGLYGKSLPPANYLAAAKRNLVHQATRLTSFESIRDMLANGYGVSSCGSEGFSNSRNDDGVSARKGSWAHAMAYIGADDRDTTKQKYGGPLVLVMNSWGRWNSGPRRVLGTDLDIPEGSFWARWSDISRRTVHCYGGLHGWPRRNLPDWLGGLA